MWRSKLRILFNPNNITTIIHGSRITALSAAAEAPSARIQVFTCTPFRYSSSFSRLLSTQPQPEPEPEPVHTESFDSDLPQIDPQQQQQQLQSENENEINDESVETAAEEWQAAAASEEITPDEVDVSDLVLGLLKQGFDKQVLELKLQTLGPDRVLPLESVVFEATELHGPQIVRFFQWLMIKDPDYVPRLRKIFKAVFRNGGAEVRLLIEFLDELALHREDAVRESDLNYLMRLLGQNQRPLDAIEVLQNFEKFNFQPGAVSYVIAIQELCKGSRFVEASDLLEQMLKIGRFPEIQDCRSLMNLFCESNRASSAYRLCLKMLERGKFPALSNLYSLMQSLCNAGETDSAAELVRRIVRDPKNCAVAFRDRDSVETLVSIMKSVCSRNVEEGRALAAEIADAAIPRCASAYDVVIKHLCRDNRVDAALRMLEEMKEKNVKPHLKAYNAIMSWYVKARKMEEACQIFARAESLYPKLNPKSYHLLVVGFWKTGDLQRAHNYLHELRKRGYTPSKHLFNHIARAFCLKQADWRSADALLNDMEVHGLSAFDSTKKLVLALKELENEELQRKSTS